jgi:hypothetical protein
MSIDAATARPFIATLYDLLDQPAALADYLRTQDQRAEHGYDSLSDALWRCLVLLDEACAPCPKCGRPQLASTPLCLNCLAAATPNPGRNAPP